jgi:hypothetical protein
MRLLEALEAMPVEEFAPVVLVIPGDAVILPRFRAVGMCLEALEEYELIPC